MGMLKEYEPEPLVAAVINLDWNVEHAKVAMKTIQETILIKPIFAIGNSMGDEAMLEYAESQALVVANNNEKIVMKAMQKGWALL
jgi:hypothetical protein